MTDSDVEFESGGPRPHVELEDGSCVVNRLNGERMNFKDGFEDGYKTDIEYKDGVLVVGVFESGVGVTLYDSGEKRVLDDIDVELVREEDHVKIFQPVDEEYHFNLTFHRMEAEA